jgi:hypothetical protein
MSHFHVYGKTETWGFCEIVEKSFKKSSVSASLTNHTMMVYFILPAVSSTV